MLQPASLNQVHPQHLTLFLPPSQKCYNHLPLRLSPSALEVLILQSFFKKRLLFCYSSSFSLPHLLIPPPLVGSEEVVPCTYMYTYIYPQQYTIPLSSYLNTHLFKTPRSRIDLLKKVAMQHMNSPPLSGYSLNAFPAASVSIHS